MINYFNDVNIKLTALQCEKFENFKKLLLFYNNSFNITSIIEDKEINIKHFIDSVCGESYFKNGAKVIEIGSGGGFPSIPLKILRDDLYFTLSESTGKKCQFLNTVIKELDLDNIEVVNDRAENLAKMPKFREKFDVAVARAVAKLNTLSEYCMPFVKIGGLFIAYKGDAENEISQAENAVKILGGKIKEIKNYSLPENMGNRNIIITEKIKETDKKYPRGQGKERSKPL